MEGVGGGGGAEFGEPCVSDLTVRVVGDVRTSVKVYENNGCCQAHG